MAEGGCPVSGSTEGSCPVADQVVMGKAGGDGTSVSMFSAPVAVVVATEGMVIQQINARALDLFGYTNKEELIGNNVKMLMPTSIARGHDMMVNRYLTTKEPRVVGSTTGRQVTGKRLDGSFLSLVLTLDKYDGGFCAAFQDISEVEKLRQDRDKLTMDVQQREIAKDTADHKLGELIVRARSLVDANDFEEMPRILDAMQSAMVQAREEREQEELARQAVPVKPADSNDHEKRPAFGGFFRRFVAKD